MKLLRTLYWNFKLVGYTVNDAKNIIYSTNRNVRFRVEGDNNRTPWYRKERLNLTTNEDERITKVRIG